jgi:type I restriction enzyme M protein
MNSKHNSNRLVQKLWRFCDVLRDDGLSYPDYVEQLTYLLFLKMAEEKDAPYRLIPPGLNWSTLVSRRGQDLHTQYGKILTILSQSVGMLGLIFKHAQNKIKDPAKLQKLIIDLVDAESWSAMGVDIKGAAYEGLLDKTAQDIKSGAGQYFTPRPLIDAIVEVLQPQYGELICDPAAGTAGFLLSCHRFITRQNPKLTARNKMFLRIKAYRGTELVESVARLGAMNLFLHGIGPAENDSQELPISVEDSLALAPSCKFDLVLTNPPFGRKSAISLRLEESAAGKSSIVRPDFIVQSNNKQLNFLQHVISLLKEGGRAAVIIPDNVLFETGAAERIRRHILKELDLHTILRLPTGIFYAQGVKANVLFFDKSRPEMASDVWIYDLREGTKFSLRTNPMEAPHLAEFVRGYSYPDRGNREHTTRGSIRWKRFKRSELLQNKGCRLDIQWSDALSIRRPSSEALAKEIIHDLRAALSEMDVITKLLAE